MITKKVFSDASYYKAERQPQLKADIEHAEEQITKQAARIAALEAEKAKLIEALRQISMACNAELFDVENVPTEELGEAYKTYRKIEEDAESVLAEVTGHAK